MNSKAFLCFSIFFFLFSFANAALDITKLLDKYPEFSKFNSHLTQTQVAAQINSRQTITVLVVDNDNISPLTGKPADVLRKIMSLHVVLDYFDAKKLQTLDIQGVTLTTLYQASGQAAGQQGFLKATKDSTGGVVISSAAGGSNHGATVVKSVIAQPYNVSVLQVSTIIVPLGIDKAQSPGSATSPATSPMPGTGAATPASAPSKPGPTPPSSSPSGPMPGSPATSPMASPPPLITAPAPSGAPAEANTPAAAPGSLPSQPPGSPPMAAAPSADGPAADAPAGDSPSADTVLQLGVSVVMTAVALTVQLPLAV